MNTLYEFITYLQYGTKLHIGVDFIGSIGDDRCVLPFEHTIHASKICNEFKGREGGLARCFRCRNAAINIAIHKKRAFGNVCVNGVYEYTRPVIIDGKIICIIYIGNILDEPVGLNKLRENLKGQEHLLETLEKDFGFHKCDTVGALIENYILSLLQDTKNPSTKKNNQLIENIKAYINSNLEYDIKLSQIAKLFSYNEQYLGRLFTKETGENMNQYVSKRRLEYAAELIKETPNSIIDIATISGFNNVTYFDRLFKKMYGMTPREFRNQSKGDIK